MLKRLTMLLATSCASAALAGQSGWTISESSGSVQVSRNGIVKASTRGSAVNAGDTVITGIRSRAVLVRGTEYMMVSARSKLRLPAEGESGGITKIFEDFGNVVFMIKKKMTPHFEVRTPYLAAVVKGTTFSVGVTVSGGAVQVLEGAVDVATADGGAHELLLPGAVALVGADNLQRMQIEADGVRRMIESPLAPSAAPLPPVAPPAAIEISGTSSAGPEQPQTGSTSSISSTVPSAGVSLADVTAGLVTGTLDNMQARNDVAAAGAASGIATESTRAATQTIAAVETKVAAAAVAETVVASAQESDAAAKVSSEADAAAKATNAEASRAADEAAKAAKDAAQADAASSTAALEADAAAVKAAAAAEDASRAAADQAAKADMKDKSAKDAAEAARAAEKAAKDAAKAAEDAIKNSSKEAEKAAKDAAEAAEKAAKDAEKAAKDAQKAADEAARSEADKVAKDLEKAAKQSDADKAAKDAQRAADEASKAAADRSGKDAEKAAKDAAELAARAAADAAKKSEDAAKAAAKQAEEAAKAAKKAAEDANKGSKGGDAGNELEKILKDKKG